MDRRTGTGRSAYLPPIAPPANPAYAGSAAVDSAPVGRNPEPPTVPLAPAAGGRVGGRYVTVGVHPAPVFALVLDQKLGTMEWYEIDQTHMF